MTIRGATIADVPGMLEIYAPIVRETTTSFELEPPTEAEFWRRVQACQERHLWLVAEDEGVVGYAYGSTHRARAAYQWSVETSIYLRPAVHRRGLGRHLYQELLEQLTSMGYCQAFAGVTQPNAASERFHQALGFEPIGVFRSVGFKFGQWCDVSWWQRQLRDQPSEA